MALTSYSGLQTYIANVLARSDLTSEIVDAIRLVEATLNTGDMANEIEPLRVRRMETTSTSNTPSSGDITLASDFLEMMKGGAVVYADSTPVILKYAEPDWLRTAYPTTATGTPRYYTIVGSTLSIRPTGTADVEYDYYQQIPALALNDPNWLLTLAPQVYIYGALFHLTVLGALSPEEGAANLALFKAAIAGLAATDMRRSGRPVAA